MKVIFLDVDGVLNADDDCVYQAGPKKGEWKARCPHVQAGYFEHYIGISNTKVQRLAQIVKETGAIIVLVSSWKDNYEHLLATNRDRIGRYLFNKLAQQGLTIHSTTLKQEKIGDPCGTYQRYVRGTGVWHWLEQHEGEVECWIALDDESFDYMPNQLSHVCLTSSFDRKSGGLNDKIMKKAIKMLNETNGIDPDDIKEDNEDEFNYKI